MRECAERHQPGMADAAGVPGLTLTWRASKASPLVITAHRMRAFLLASATAAFDRLGHQHAGVDDLGRAEVALQDHGAPARPERDLDGVGQDVDPAPDLVARGFVKDELFGGHLAHSFEVKA